MSCVPLVQRYISPEVGGPPPPLSEGKSAAQLEDVRDRWLLVSEWGCTDPSNGQFRDKEWCKQNLDTPSNTLPTGEPLPHINRLEESGFLHYVNALGPKCIQRVTGRVLSKDSRGRVLVPGTDQPQPLSECVLECNRPTPDSHMCFQCVTERVANSTAFSSMCPELSAVKSEERRQTQQDALACMGCMSQNGSSTDGIWKCVDGTASESDSDDALNSGQIAAIAISALLVFACIIVYYKHRSGGVASVTAVGTGSTGATAGNES